MEFLRHSPVFNCVKMAWVAGVGEAVPEREHLLLGGAARGAQARPHGERAVLLEPGKARRARSREESTL